MPPRRERVTGQVRNLAHGGEAVVDTSMGVVLVRGALPGEQVRIEVGDKRSGVRRGKLLDLVGEPSPERRQPACEIAGRCGGCPLMIWSLPAQHAHKRDLVAQAVAGLGVTGDVDVVMEAGDADLVYRRRARSACGVEGRAAVIGYRRAGSRGVMPVSRCVVLTPALSAVIPALSRLLSPVLAGEGEIELTPGPNGSICVSMTTDAAQSAAAYAACGELAKSDGVSGVALRAGGIGAAATWGVLEQHVPGTEQDVPGTYRLPLIGPAQGFSQANEAVNARLVERVVALAQPEGAEILELYAGNGNLTVALAKTARQVWAVELDRELVQACQANLAARGIVNVKVRADAAEAGAKGGSVDCVVLDPPRTGAKEAIDGILARKPRRIVYVSCDPITLRRDAQLLAAGGYRVTAAHALDMFPHTAHVEAVVGFVRV